MAIKQTLRELDRPALARGIVAGLLVVGPAAALAAWASRHNSAATNALSLLLFAVVLLGFAFAGGKVAGEGIPLPYTHAALAGLVTFSVVQGIVLAVSAIMGREGPISVLGLASNALLAASAGVIGAMLMSRRGHQDRVKAQEL